MKSLGKIPLGNRFLSIIAVRSMIVLPLLIWSLFAPSALASVGLARFAATPTSEGVQLAIYYYWLENMAPHGTATRHGPVYTTTLVPDNRPPVTESVSPDNGECQPGEWQTFTTTYSDPDGWQDIRTAGFLINTSPSITNCIYVRYDVQNDLMSLHHPRRGYWLPWRGGVKPGTKRVIKHNYGLLDVGQCSVVADGDTLTVTWAVQFTWRDSGKRHNLYLRAEDMAGSSVGWNDGGDWIVNRVPNWLIAPTITNNQAITTGVRYSFDPKYRDKDGRKNLDEMYFTIADALPGGEMLPSGVLLRYDLSDNAMYLYDNDGGRDGCWDWIGGYAPRTDNLIENDLVIVIVKWSKLGINDSRTWTVRWRLEFKPAFVGRHNLYMRAVDALGGDTGWKYKGWIRVEQP